MKLTKSQRSELHAKYGGHCAYCGDVLPNKWHADHVEPIKRIPVFFQERDGRDYCENPERDEISNLNPSCPSCNIIKGSSTLEGFRQEIIGFIKSLNSYSNQYKFAKRYGLIEETEVEVKFYFEKISQNNVIIQSQNFKIKS
ncbi:HNH endonuclease [Sphingobacterium hungaricum]|uniref:HNH endonuclease n=1 Tax=Sphingobacterium hungaricum TaxID=2082723 RepID=A0A928YNX3_9SPHI|nr:HNH endonuclease signature motif containing protein [Sphingobacterium hungaricum]MBE8712511.1 HNH endonuclease [Sphingobacterium hungaricum]